MVCLYKHHLDWTQLDKRVFEKIKEFCDEEAMDITCPEPKSRAGQKHALEYGFRTDRSSALSACLYSNDSLLTHIRCCYILFVLLLYGFSVETHHLARLIDVVVT